MADHAQWKIGEVTVTMLIEKHTEMPLEFLPTATEESIARHREWLRPWAYSDQGQLRFVLQRRVVAEPMTLVSPRPPVAMMHRPAAEVNPVFTPIAPG